MQFTRIQDKDTRAILSYLINDKEVSAEHYRRTEQRGLDDGKQYNSSLTTTTNNGNFKHRHFLN